MEVSRLFDILYYQLENTPLEKCLSSKVDNKWKSYSTQEVINEANKLSAGLIKKGVKPGDKIGLISFNRPEWIFADLAIEQIGAINVPLYPNITIKEYKYIIEHSNVKLAFVGDKNLFDKIKESTKDRADFIGVFSFDEIKGVPNWKSLQSSYSTEATEIEKRKKNIKPNDLATIIYTSGTTGFPKGVMLTHRNILSNSEGVSERFSIVDTKYKALSFLPLCHIFERTGSYTHMRLGVEVYFTVIENIGEAIKEIKPHYFATVPRLLEKIYSKIIKKGYALKGIKKQLFFWSIQVGDKFDPNKKHSLWYTIKLKLANKLIFNKWREALGGNILFIVSGAAALQPKLARIFWAAKIPILEAYGLTETSPGISFSKIEKGGYRLSYVGPLLKDVNVRIADDGEIQVSGPGVMQGYYKLPKQTKEVLKNGWFSTGDIGEMNNGFLKITDRKKEMFKTSGGKYIAPQQLENKCKESMFIEQIMVVGEGRKHPAALIVPDFELVSEWCKDHHLSFDTVSDMLKNENVIAKFDKEVAHYNSAFSHYERIKKYTLLFEPWSIEKEELTATLKLKRKNILKKYSTYIEKIYKED